MKNTPLSKILELRGKVAIVTGAGRGIGQAIALRLAEAGAAVLVTDIDEDSASETVEFIRRAQGRAEALAVDSSKPADTERAILSAEEYFGDLDILVNNAAIFPATPLLEITEQQWDRVLEINLKGTFFFAQAAAKKMIENKHGGKIINISSFAWLIPPGSLAHYDASKGGVVSVTKSLAKELGQFSICVNAVAPGIIETPGSQISSAAVAKAMNLNLSELPTRSVLGRNGSADDIAKAVYFLATGLSDYVTGSVLEVGGGYHLI